MCTIIGGNITMKANLKIRTFKYVGNLAHLIEEFITEKKALGYKYETEAEALRKFSEFTLDFEIPKNTLPLNVIDSWIKRRPMESSRSNYARFAIVKLFAEYMIRLGYKAYCPRKEELGRIQWAYTPYIFTHQEIRNFFLQADSLKIKAHSTAPRRHIIMPVLFRMLYCCGLRISEVINLKAEDISLEDGILTIRESKFGKTRYVPMSNQLTEICRKYAVNNIRNRQDYFFRSPSDNVYSAKAIYHNFREILWMAGISHGGRGKGPRVHDLRHTFAVHCLEKWILNGKDLSTALPRLSTYLGHESLTGTERYLRMTSELYPQIIELLDQKYGYIIPQEWRNNYENNQNYFEEELS